MPALGQITKPKPVSTPIDFGDGVIVQLIYDRNRVTSAWLDRARGRDVAHDTLSIAKALAEVILEWDVTTDDGQPYPPTVENLAVFSIPDLSQILAEVVKFAQPSSAEGNASSAPSSTPPSGSISQAETPPNGQAASPLLSASASTPGT